MLSGSLFHFLPHSFMNPTAIPSIEAITSENEKEVVLYARIGKPEGLQHAAHWIKQVQGQIIGPRSRIRVRREEFSDGRITYQITTKKPVSYNGTQVMQENTADITEDAFKVFIGACDQVFDKTRYVFPIEKATILTKDLSAEVEIEGLKYEVDVFNIPGKTQQDWCKIDVEVQSLLPQLADKGLQLTDVDLNIKLKTLPFEPHAYFVDTGEKTGPMRDLVTAIYDTQFVTKLQD